MKFHVQMEVTVTVEADDRLHAWERATASLGNWAYWTVEPVDGQLIGRRITEGIDPKCLPE